MLQLLLGPSGSGKSHILLEQLRARAQAGKPGMLLVPEQFTSSTEARLYRALGDELSGRVVSYSFSSLAEALLSRYGGAATKTLTDAGRAVLVRRAMESLGTQVTYYRRHRRSTVFCQKAADTINELKSAGITPEAFHALVERIGGGPRLAELALLYTTYEALLRDTALDPGDRVRLAAEKLEPAFFAGMHVYLDEFDTFNASKRALLRAILPVADVTVALCCDGPTDRENGMGLFSGIQSVAQMLRRMAQAAGVDVRVQALTDDHRHADAPALAALNQLLMGREVTPFGANPAQLTLYKAKNCREEVRAVAATITKLARQGVPYHNMAVVCRNAEQYQAELRRQFRLFQIPLFVDGPDTPENTAPARAVRGALALLRGGVSSENVLRLVKTGLCDMTDSQQCALENYAYTWQLKAADWRAPFAWSPSGFGSEMTDEDTETLALAESARAFLMEPIGAFLEKAKGASGTDFGRQIYFLWQKLGAENALQQLSDALRAERGIPAAQEALREWNLVMGLLDQLCQLTADEELTAAETDELFGLLLRSSDLSYIPQSLDSVIFTTAGRMRLDDIDACFVLGLAEGEFPQAPGDLGLLTHADRDALMAQDVEMPDSFEGRTIREMICFYKALTVGSRYVWLSWAEGAAGLPVCGDLTAVLDALQPAAPRLTLEEYAATPAAALDALGENWQQDGPEAAALYAALQKIPGQQNALAALRRMALPQPFAAKDTAALETVLGRGLYISPSRVERFYTCRFAYFMEYVLHIRPRKKAQLTPNESGSLVHWVLEQALARTGEQFVQLSREELETLGQNLTDEYVRANLPQATARLQYLVARLKKNVCRLLLFLQQEARQSDFVPEAFELKIGEGEGEIPPIHLQTADGHNVTVVGTVDRVDVLRKNGESWLRVVDYKTGEKKFRLEEVYCGLDCQMLLYLFTLTRNGGERFGEAKPAGVLYLKADPRPAGNSKKELVYPVDGLVLDDPTVLQAMDKDAQGLFLPFRMKKDGTPYQGSEDKLANLSKLGRIRQHIDTLVTEMARQLYAGSIDAAPLCKDKNSTPCQWCDYRAVCRHEDGIQERALEAPEAPFEEEVPHADMDAGTEAGD